MKRAPSSPKADFRALKIRLGRDSVKDDLRAIAEVRRAVGDDIVLMSDFNQGLTFNRRSGGCMRSTIRRWNGSRSRSSSTISPVPRGSRTS